ncbi:MAG: hypothetical protein IJP10_02025, partial [Clostridia bacterium]|nr:hypothetical protein [Clostridia bacterium]
CGLLTRKDSDYTQEELWDLHKSPASLDDMRIIVAYYLSYISKDDVSICPIQMPHSSYAYKIDEKYREKITENFWSDFPIYDSAVIDAATFDIDSDGIEEYCVLRYGPTSGLFTFCILAYENDRLEYFNIFNTMHMSLSFETNEEGQTILVGRDGDNTYRMSFDIRYGNIVILNDDLQILYWGMQGPYSSWLPRQ